MKKALILGTSHSAGSCKDDPRRKSRRMNEGRWHDYLSTELGYEVVNISMANCSAQQQFVAVMAYLQDNPDAEFDIAFVEGRHMETVTSQPRPLSRQMTQTRRIANSVIYEPWLDETHHTKKRYHPVGVISPQDHQIIPEYSHYYTDYVFSYQHFVDTWTTNVGICNLLKQRSKNVFFFTMACVERYDDPEHDYIKKAELIMSDYILDKADVWKLAANPVSKDIVWNKDDKCLCGHFNASGHEKWWRNIVYPKYKDFL